MKSSLVHATILASMDPESDQEEMPIKSAIFSTVAASRSDASCIQREPRSLSEMTAAYFVEHFAGTCHRHQLSLMQIHC
jgi:hypothetical protein